ncbi:MAG: hypothetical protein EA424_03165 [Planctomycetaceae bacterium]|nr:MAG: hypothetical protein EA424_03165 [Planctomycetaceae bacterium]
MNKLMDPTRLERARRVEARHRFVWVGTIVAMLAAQVLLMMLIVYVTTVDESFAVEPNYYQQSLDWDATMAQRRHNQQLGWQLELSVADQANLLGDRQLVGRLTDRDGHPLDGAVIELVAFPHARGNDRRTATLLPMSEGSYETTLRIPRGGKWEFRVAVQHDSETFTHIELHDVNAPRALP